MSKKFVYLLKKRWRKNKIKANFGYVDLKENEDKRKLLKFSLNSKLSLTTTVGLQ